MRGLLAELLTPRFALIEVCVMHFSERCLAAPFIINQLLFSPAYSKSFLLSFYSQAICRADYRSVPLLLRQTDICPHKQGPVQRGGTLPKVEIEIHHLD